MRQRPHAFLKIGTRWINMAMVTDIEDHGERLTIYMASDMARLSSGANPLPVDVARRVSIEASDEVEKVKRWLMLNDVE